MKSLKNLLTITLLSQAFLAQASSPIIAGIYLDGMKKLIENKQPAIHLVESAPKPKPDQVVEVSKAPVKSDDTWRGGR